MVPIHYIRIPIHKILPLSLKTTWLAAPRNPSGRSKFLPPAQSSKLDKRREPRPTACVMKALTGMSKFSLWSPCPHRRLLTQIDGLCLNPSVSMNVQVASEEISWLLSNSPLKENAGVSNSSQTTNKKTNDAPKSAATASVLESVGACVVVAVWRKIEVDLWSQLLENRRRDQLAMTSEVLELVSFISLGTPSSLSRRKRLESSSIWEVWKIMGITPLSWSERHLMTSWQCIKVVKFYWDFTC